MQQDFEAATEAYGYLQKKLKFSSSENIQACNFIKKETPTPVSSCEICEIFKKTFFTGHLRCLLLNKKSKILAILIRPQAPCNIKKLVEKLFK